MMLAAHAVDVCSPAYTATFSREHATVPAARQMVALALREWDLEVLADEATLVCSELVTNAIVHATSPCLRLTVTRRGEKRVKISVADRSRVGPTKRLCVAGSDEQGRGLIIVDRVSQMWGVDFMRWGKRVWAFLEVP